MLLLLCILLFVPLTSMAQNITCHVKGRCDGIVVGLTLKEDYNDCLNTCKGNTNCNWFTFFDGLNDCFQYSDCPSVEQDGCNDCYTGQKQCQPEFLCDVPGFCQGHMVAFNLTNSAKECLELCQQFENCNYYTYLSESRNCLLTEDCTELDQSCTDCVAGEKSCYQDVSSFSKLLVVAGNDAFYKVELVDLSEGGENKTCPRMPDYPGPWSGSVGTYIGGKAMVCGGDDPFSYSPLLIESDCYFYSKSNDSWVQTVSMKLTRAYAAAVQLSSKEWWITGGDHYEYNSTEVYNVDQDSFSYYTDLPEEKAYHNLVQINSTHFMLLGGNINGSNKTWMFDRGSQVWTPLPDLLEVRRRTHAGLVKYKDGRQAVLVAGGFDSITSEIFDLEQQIWKYGPDLPVEEYLGGGASVQYKDSFLIVGGYGNLELMKTIFTFDPVTEDWMELPQKLVYYRAYFTAFMVPDDFAECT